MSPATVARYRVSACDFTRQRCLTFPLVVLLTLRGHKQALQNVLNKLFTALGAVPKVPTASALCQARHKFKPELFLYLQEQICQRVYALPRREVLDEVPGEVSDGVSGSDPVRAVWVWQGHRVLGVDGTRWNVPDTPQNREHFGCATNQHEGFCCAQAQGSILYDVLGDIGLNAVLAPITSEKALLFAHHLPFTQKGDVLVMDRLYCDYSVLAFLAGNGREFVVRAPRSSFRAVRAFWQSSERQRIVTVGVTPDQKKWVEAKGLPTQLRLRLVKITLDTGKVEVLVTSLCDAKRYAAEELAQVYAWRWRVESYIDRLKNIFEVERLASVRREHLKQDFYGVMFLATLESVLVRPAQHALGRQSQQRGTRYEQQVNRAVSYSALLDHTLVLLTDQGKSPEQVLQDLDRLFLTNPVPKRKGRSFPREKPSASQKLRFYRYKKRALT